MKKIPTLYERDQDDPRRVTNVVTYGCEWVIDGEGYPTRKFDGTCIMLNDRGEWYARREVKEGRPSPPGFIVVDTQTKKITGWEPIGLSPFAKFFNEAAVNWLRDNTDAIEPGTFELCGPKINGNPEKLDEHRLIPHGADEVGCPDDTPAFLIDICRRHGWEGVVWWHPDGRRAKLKVRDYRC